MKASSTHRILHQLVHWTRRWRTTFIHQKHLNNMSQIDGCLQHNAFHRIILERCKNAISLQAPESRTEKGKPKNKRNGTLGNKKCTTDTTCAELRHEKKRNLIIIHLQLRCKVSRRGNKWVPYTPGEWGFWMNNWIIWICNSTLQKLLNEMKSIWLEHYHRGSRSTENQSNHYIMGPSDQNLADNDEQQSRFELSTSLKSVGHGVKGTLSEGAALWTVAFVNSGSRNGWRVWIRLNSGSWRNRWTFPHLFERVHTRSHTIGIDFHRLLRLFIIIPLSLPSPFHRLPYRKTEHLDTVVLQLTHKVAAVLDQLSI